MVVRVAQRAAMSKASQVVVAADSPEIVTACEAHGIRALLTRVDHPSGSDRLAEASALLGLTDDDMVSMCKAMNP
jgi:3-deoxy-manno-octulosonate cytidylyltransferase (CMP-KDO synthetase)